jgi:RNA polymerase sigma-70 factor (subfamily 1)
VTIASDEHDLTTRAIAGDTAALSLLLERHGLPIAASLDIARKWRSMVSPEDVMQVTYLEAFLRINDFVPAGPGAFGAWLRRIAENNLRDAIKELRRAKRPQPDQRVGMPIDDRSYVDLVQLLADGTGGATPSGEAAASEAASFVEVALARLPDDYARAIRLYELQGLAIRDVATNMGRSEGSIKMLLARARDRLREELGSRSRFFSQ